MKKLEKEICNVMYSFVKEHINEVKDSYEDLGFKDEKDMLSKIKRNITDSIWALTELCYWGLGQNYYKSFIHEEFATDDDAHVYVIEDSNKIKRYFIVDYENWIPREVESETKLVEIKTWTVKNK
jgi:hypothetical protein